MQLYVFNIYIYKLVTHKQNILKYQNYTKSLLFYLYFKILKIYENPIKCFYKLKKTDLFK